MDRTLRTAAELNVLRSLCDERNSREERLELCNAFSDYRFLDAEHQVVFESIRTFLALGDLSAERLAQNLVRRGFPDTDMQLYFVADPPSLAEAQRQIAALLSE